MDGIVAECTRASTLGPDATAPRGNENLDFTRIGGGFAAATETAVDDFQGGNGLIIDGIVGPVTWAALPADPMPPTLSQGSSGISVFALQKSLKTYAWQTRQPTPLR